jgi:hypothetical protein
MTEMVDKMELQQQTIRVETKPKKIHHSTPKPKNLQTRLSIMNYGNLTSSDYFSLVERLGRSS